MSAKAIGIIVGVVAVAAMAVALSKRKPSNAGDLATNPDYMGIDRDGDGVFETYEYLGGDNIITRSSPTSAAHT